MAHVDTQAPNLDTACGYWVFAVDCAGLTKTNCEDSTYQGAHAFLGIQNKTFIRPSGN